MNKTDNVASKKLNLSIELSFLKCLKNSKATSIEIRLKKVLKKDIVILATNEIVQDMKNERIIIIDHPNKQLTCVSFFFSTNKRDLRKKCCKIRF